MSSPAEDQRWKGRTANSPLAPSPNIHGQRRNPLRDHNSNSYSSGGFQGGKGGGPWQGTRNAQGLNQQQPGGSVEEHVPVRGFNSREVSDYLNRGYMAAFTAAKNPYDDEASKPLIYKSSEKAWETPRPSGGAWGVRQHVMANQFLTQLRQGVNNLLPAKE